MTIQIVGAAMPRTGTTSLSVALARLTGQPCYQMLEFFEHPEHAPTWLEAIEGRPVDWPALLSGYSAVVDTPACLVWKDIAEAFPNAPVLLTRRQDADAWFASLEPTVLFQMRRAQELAQDGVLQRALDLAKEGRASLPGWLAHAAPEDRPALLEVFTTIGPRLLGDLSDPDAMMTAYEAFADDVRATVPSHRLVEWHPGQGWEPLCAALEVKVPDEPFPHENLRADFVARA